MTQHQKQPESVLQTLQNHPHLPFVSSIHLPSHNSPPLDVQILFSLSSHFSTIYQPLLKLYISPWL